jgi:MYXO-CTERM domain-containing protein
MQLLRGTEASIWLEAEYLMKMFLSLFAVCVVASGLAIGQSNAQSSDATNPNANRAAAPPVAQSDDSAPRRDHNWGWIGLLGLAGLAGLGGRRRADQQVSRDRAYSGPDQVRRAG